MNNELHLLCWKLIKKAPAKYERALEKLADAIKYDDEEHMPRLKFQPTCESPEAWRIVEETITAVQTAWLKGREDLMQRTMPILHTFAEEGGAPQYQTDAGHSFFNAPWDVRHTDDVVDEAMRLADAKKLRAYGKKKPRWAIRVKGPERWYYEPWEHDKELKDQGIFTLEDLKNAYQRRHGEEVEGQSDEEDTSDAEVRGA